MAPRTQRDLEEDIRKGIDILESFTGRDPRTVIPKSILANAHGLILIRVFRIGMMVSTKNGTGIIIARNPDGSWSAPSGISLTSFGAGYQIGAETVNLVIVMNYRAAIKAFVQGGGQFQLGVTASLAAGPYGLAAEVSAGTNNGDYVAVTYSYSSSKGLFIGYSMEGSKVSERPNTNSAFYGRPITAKEILEGGVSRPPVARRLYEILDNIGAGPRVGGGFGPKTNRSPSFLSQNDSRSLSPNLTNGNFGSPIVNPSIRGGQTEFQHTFAEPPPPYEPRKDAINNGEGSSVGYNNRYSEQSYENYPRHNYPPRDIADTSIHRTTSYSSKNTFNRTESSHSSHSEHGYNQYPYHNEPHISENMNSNEVKRSVPPIPQQEQSYTVVTALYDYHGDRSNELSFSAGDTIIVTKRNGDRESWWEGEIGSKHGAFPANYTEDLTD